MNARDRIFELQTPRFGALLVLATTKRQAREIGKRFDATHVRSHTGPRLCRSCDSAPCCCA